MPIQLLRELRKVQYRLQWINLMRRFLWSLAIGALFMLLFVIISRLVPLIIAPMQVLPYAVGAVLCATLLWSVLRGVGTFQAALAADEALGLRERLSSAALIGEPRNSAEAAVIMDAVECAQRIHVGRDFPARLNRELKWAGLPVALLALTWWLMPQFDLRAAVKPIDAKTDPKAMKTATPIESSKKLEALAGKIEELNKAKPAEATKAAEREISELAKQLREKKLTSEQAAAKLNKIADKLGQQQQGLQDKINKAGNLQNLGQGKHTRELAKALENGNFGKAAEEMKALQEKMKNGSFSEQEKKALQKELEQMSEKLGTQTSLGKCMAKAAEAGKQSQQEQKEGGQQAGDNQFANEMEQAAGEMKELQQAMDQSGEMGEMKEDLAARSKAMLAKEGDYEPDQPSDEGEDGEGTCPHGEKKGKCGKCKGQGEGEGEGSEGRGQDWGEWKEGDSREKGQGGGGPGIGEGGVAKTNDSGVGFKKSKVKGNVQAGKIIARMKVEGEQIKGDIATEYEAMRLNNAQQAEKAVENEALPLEYKSLVRGYFDAIKAGDKPAAKPGAAAPADAAPAEEEATEPAEGATP